MDGRLARFGSVFASKILVCKIHSAADKQCSPSFFSVVAVEDLSCSLSLCVYVHVALVGMYRAGDSGARSYFVLGFDIAVDTQLRVWVMEVRPNEHGAITSYPCQVLLLHCLLAASQSFRWNCRHKLSVRARSNIHTHTNAPSSCCFVPRSTSGRMIILQLVHTECSQIPPTCRVR